MKSFFELREKHLTPAEMKKREEIAMAMHRKNPTMDKSKVMAIATSTAKKVAEATQDMSSMGGRSLARIANTPNHPDAAAAKNELARRRMKNEQVAENTLSAKAARAGKDIGKPGKTFDKIAAKAAEKYGSKEAGQKVAGAILKKMRANEEVELDEADESKAHDRHYEKQTPAVQNALNSYTRQGMSYTQAHAKISNPMGGHRLRKEITPLHEEQVNEATDMSKLKMLARAGLVDQKNVEKLMAAFKTMEAGKPLSQQQKDLVISSYGELASIVTGDSQTFQKAKKAVAEAVESFNK